LPFSWNTGSTRADSKTFQPQGVEFDFRSLSLAVPFNVTILKVVSLG